MNFIQYSQSEYWADFIVHALSLVACVTAAVSMLRYANRHRGTCEQAILAVYAGCAFFMFSVSAAYNITAPSYAKMLLQAFDHAGIFLMIAGTYTPTIYYSLRGRARRIVLSLYWLVGLAGILIRAVEPALFELISLPIYVLYGWSGLLFIAILNGLSTSLANPGYYWMVVGGLIYTLGIGFHIAEALAFHNAIWHGFVLSAAGTQFYAVSRLANTWLFVDRAPPTASLT